MGIRAGLCQITLVSCIFCPSFFFPFRYYYCRLNVVRVRGALVVATWLSVCLCLCVSHVDVYMFCV